MRILALMTLDIFRRSLGEAFEDMGHDVRYLGDFELHTLENLILEFKPDMVVDMGWDTWHEAARRHGALPFIRDIFKKHQLFHLYFAEEDWLHFDRWSKKYCTIMRPSFVLTRSPLTIDKYDNIGIPATYFDVGSNPKFHKPSPKKEKYICDVAVVANGNFKIGEIRYKSVNDLVTPLLEQNNLDVKLWGRDWEGLNRFYFNKNVPKNIYQGNLPFTETPSVYSSAKISISIQTCQDQLSNRTFDILSSGGFLLTSDTKAVREKLRPGVDCVVTRSPEETMELVNYYVNNEDERKQIAEEGLRVATERFSYQKSLLRVWPEIEKEWRNKQKWVSKTTPKNILRNGLFKDSLALDWICNNADLVVNSGYNGSNSIKFKEGEVNAFIQQKVTVTPGKNYLLSAYFAKDGTEEGAPVNIIIYYYNNKNEIVEMGLYASLFDKDTADVKENNWFQFRGVTLNVPDDADYATILINKTSQKDCVPILVSNCEFREIVL